MKGLAKNRQERQPDAVAFDKELQAALTGNYAATSTPRSGRSGSNAWKWLLAIAVVAILSVGLVISGVAIKYGLDRSRVVTTPTGTEEKTVTSVDLRGHWAGNYGPAGSSATLVITNQSGKDFDGVLEQGTNRVAFKGTLETETIHMKQTEVLSGSDWSLGEDTGKLSNDGKRMSGTGKDAVGGSFGIAYQWSFSR